MTLQLFNNSLHTSKKTESSISAYINVPDKPFKMMPNSYQTEVHNVNKRVQSLISELEPTPEERVRQNAIHELQLAA